MGFAITIGMDANLELEQLNAFGNYSGKEQNGNVGYRQ